MSKLFVVFGATGRQGGSTISYVLDDPELSKQYKIRAVTRDPSNPKLSSFKERGVEVVKGDFNDVSSLKAAVAGAFVVFGVTLTVYDPVVGTEEEVKQGKSIVDAAVEAGAKYFIWSSAVDPDKVSNGKYKHVSIYAGKSGVMDYIKSQPITGIYYFPGSFMQNYHVQNVPVPLGDGTYGIFGRCKPDTEVPVIDINDTGKFIGAILENLDKFADQFISAAEGVYTYEEIVARIAKVTGKKITYHQTTSEQLKENLPPPLKPFAGVFNDFFQLIDEFGYYGPDSKKQVENWSKQARGKLTTIEEFFEKNPPPFN
ncbi:NmrA-like family domain-containing protein 1 [Meyerozyma sp. JA9]|nr:NmrA-like family domain-containing protein 1 [Meyerozyma sp. JA9]